MDIFSLTFFFLVVVNLDIVRTEEPDDTSDTEMTEMDLLLTPTVVFGFSLNDKIWCTFLTLSLYLLQIVLLKLCCISFSVEFSVDKIQDIEWNDEAFDNLVLPHDHKYLLQSLVQAHHNEIGFDDFIKGKGHGLVVNLFGPPGVGE